MNKTDTWMRSDWHKRSWDELLDERLPEMLSSLCCVVSYQVFRGGGGVTVSAEIAAEDTDKRIDIQFSEIPYPDERGVFTVNDSALVVVPVAEDPALSGVQCAGELAEQYLVDRLPEVGTIPLDTDEGIRTWLPLSTWLHDFLTEHGQTLDATNMLSVITHTRRVLVRDMSDVAPSGQIGLVCPFETPEGPNIGRVLTVAVGAEIREGQVVRRADSRGVEGATLGPAAAMIPFLGCDDAARVLMGANMMRQWVPPTKGERALVRTDWEPEDPRCWCGYNLLTAFMSAGRLTYEDGIVLSRSAADRMRYDRPLELGDKLSNRHGYKGVISKILPDEAMPRLPTGRPVECMVSFIGLHTRMNAGQLWEAVYGFLAEQGQTCGKIGPFTRPDADVVRGMLSALGMDETCAARLKLPEGGATESPVATGIVYWGKTRHLAAEKLRFGGVDAATMVQGEMECDALRDLGAFGLLCEYNGVLSEENETIEAVAKAVRTAAEPENPAIGFRMARLKRILRKAGIEVAVAAGGLSFSFAAESGRTLPEPVVHPWRWDRSLSAVPGTPNDSTTAWVSHAAERLKTLLGSDAPASLIESARSGLRRSVRAYFDSLLDRQDFVTRGRVYFSGRGVLIPGADLSPWQVGIPEDMAWGLFGPFVEAVVGVEGVRVRNAAAQRALADVMSERWVVVNRAPTLTLTALLGFRPVVVSHHAVELHPLVCRWLNADFDGDQVAVVHPITTAGQRDVAERLSVTAHLERDPSLVASLAPTNEALWGLSVLSRDRGNRPRIADVLGGLPRMPEGYLRADDLAAYAKEVLAKRGAANTVKMLERAYDLGVEAARRSGASFRVLPMAGSGVAASRAVERSQVAEVIASSQDFNDVAFGDQLTAVKCGARGKVENLTMLLHSRLIGAEPTGTGPADIRPTAVKTGEAAQAEPMPTVGADRTACGMVFGIGEEEAALLAMEMRRRMQRIVADITSMAEKYRDTRRSTSYNVLARAARSECPGVVIASAASTGEVDRLEDVDARIFAGIMVDAECDA